MSVGQKKSLQSREESNTLHSIVQAYIWELTVIFIHNEERVQYKAKLATPIFESVIHNILNSYILNHPFGHIYKKNYNVVK